MAKQFRIEPLSGGHDRARFSSGSDPLDRYFREQASQDIKRRIAACFVAVSVETGHVAGFYTLTAAGIALSDLSPEIVRKLPRYPVVPAALLGRLAVARDYQGKGLGGVLLANAVLRAARAETGVFAMVVDAKDEAVQRFYEHYGFTLLPGADRRLCLPISIALQRFIEPLWCKQGAKPVSCNLMSTLAMDLAPPELIAKYEPVIGLEVHVQLGTRTKIFCGCPTGFGALPNTNVCPVCLGLPGALPVLSREAVELAMKAGMALNCAIRPLSRFARKNYFYPDSPKGYQISMYDEPLAEHGFVDIEIDGRPKRIGVTRVHMEDDAGKSQHDGFADSSRYTYVDLNRCGAPLIEIVSEPDMRSADEAFAYLSELKQTLQFVEVSTCDMEKGHLRCDANVSVRLKGAEKFGTRTETKNLNSFRFLKQAIEYEIARQVAIVESGGAIHQETRLFNSDTGETVGMRSKEDAHDYRYFPEPDLVPLRIGDKWREEVRATMPELPAAKRARFIEVYGLREYDAQVLTSTRAMAEYYEVVAEVSKDPKMAANWVMGDLAGLLKELNKEIAESPVPARYLGELVGMIVKGELTGKMAKEVLPKIVESGDAPSVIVEREGLKQISDSGALEKIVDEVIAANPKQVEQFKSGKTTVIGFLVGQVMKASRGQANPATVNEILKSRLE